MKVLGIEVSEEEISEALETAKSGDTMIDVPDGNGGRMPLTVICKAAVSEDGRVANVRHNIKRDVLRFMQLPYLWKLRQDPIAIVGGGPSVAKYLDEIRKFKFVMAAGSSHDYLVENGIIPTFAVSTDPKEETNDYYQHLQKGTNYLVASQCPPILFDRLVEGGYNVAMWHFRDQVDEEEYLGEQSICWGCMVGVNCIQMALHLGFQEHHYFGYDCSMEDEVHHAYEVHQWEQDEIVMRRTIAEIGEKKTKFFTTTALICQATHFFGIYRSNDGNYLKGKVYGNGMLANIIQQTPGIEPWLEAVDHHPAEITALCDPDGGVHFEAA